MVCAFLTISPPCELHVCTVETRFANNPNLDMDDAMTGAATQEFQDVSWTDDGSDGVSATLEVNFLKFQKLSFLAIYARSDDEIISLRKLRLLGRA